MDEALFSVLEQISGILSGYVAGIRASKGLGSSTTPQPAHFEQREHKCNILQFVPRNQLFKLEQQEQQKRQTKRRTQRGHFYHFAKTQRAKTCRTKEPI